MKSICLYIYYIFIIIYESADAALDFETIIIDLTYS